MRASSLSFGAVGAAVLRQLIELLADETALLSSSMVSAAIWQKAAEAGLEWFELAYAVELELHRAYASLGCIPPSYEPRATGHITEMIELINRLIERGHAYAADDGSGDVYFDVRSWARVRRAVAPEDRRHGGCHRRDPRASTIRATSPCGRAPSPTNPPPHRGPAPGAGDVPAGTLSARP